jgi:hypothetical protein
MMTYKRFKTEADAEAAANGCVGWEDPRPVEILLAGPEGNDTVAWIVIAGHEDCPKALMTDGFFN